MDSYVLNCLALYSVVAWRLMYVCYLGRECPEIDCEVIFEPSEYHSSVTQPSEADLTFLMYLYSVPRVAL